MAATLSSANQNSASPKLLAPSRLTPVSTTRNVSARTHWLVWGQRACRIVADAVASAATEIAIWAHHSHPIQAPTDLPRALSAKMEMEPLWGSAAAISPSILMIRTTRKLATI